jgi:tetratricopeptide (TPR) repeat protein
VRRLAPPLLALVAFVVFLPALHGQFLAWDDDVNLVTNEHYRGLGWPQIQWAFSNVRMGHYIPITWLSFSANYAADGMAPRGYHLVSLLAHAANAVVFYFVARRLIAASRQGGRPADWADATATWGGLAAGLLFAVHPLRVESVAWITERRDVLSGFFFLTAVLTYLRAVEARDRAAPGWMAGSLALFAAGLLCKASIMALPAVLVLLDVYPLRRGAFTWRHLVAEKAGHWIVGAGGALAALVALEVSGLRITSYGVYGPAARIAMVAYSFWFYPAAWIWPVRLSPLYELPPSVDPLAWRFLGPAVGVVAVTVALWLLRRRWPAGLAAWVYSALMILPISGVVHSGFQLAHDRYSYLSGLGFALLGGGAVAWLLDAARARRVGRPVIAAATGVAVIGLAALAVGAWQQSRIWVNSEALWRWGVAADPRCAVCANNLATVLLNRPSRTPAELVEAEGLAQRAVAVNPTYDSAYTTHGTILVARQDSRGAEQAFREAMRLAPERPAAAANLGALYARAGRYDEALPLLRAAWAKQPDTQWVRSNLGQALRDRGIGLAGQGRLAESVELLEEALRITPEDADVHRNLGLALWQQGRRAEAGPHLERAVALKPNDDTRGLLAQYRAQSRPTAPR